MVPERENKVISSITCECCKKPITLDVYILSEDIDEIYCSCYTYNLNILINYIRLFTFAVN